MKKKTPEEVNASVQALNPDLSMVLESYQGLKKPCLWNHPKGQFTRTPWNILSKHCIYHPEDGRKAISDAVKANKEEWWKKVSETNLKNYGTTTILARKDLMEKAMIERYGVTHNAKNPDSREKAFQTAKKNGNLFSSSEEREFIKTIEEETGLVSQKHRVYREGKQYTVDAYFPDQKVALEYHGLFWHREAQVGKTYHRDKYRACQEKGIKLIQVFSHEWETRRTQVLHFIKSKLVPAQNRVQARRCELIEVPKAEARQFCEDHHIQGKTVCNLAIGLRYQGKLVACATFAMHHRTGKEWVLNRLVFLPGTAVIGGAGRICTEAKRRLTSFKTWADLRWSDGAVYRAVGLRQTGALKPDYFYYHIKKHHVKPKQLMTKKNLGAAPGQTESELTTALGYCRIWDAGKITFSSTEGVKQ